MATIPTIQLLRNNNIFSSRDAARRALDEQKGNVPDGGVILARYSGDTREEKIIKTLAGFVTNISTSENATVTIIDVEDAINRLDKEDKAVEGQYVAAVSETNGIITVSRQALPSLGKQTRSGKAITAIKQTNGLVDVEFGGVAAANVSVADEGNIFTATTVEGVLSEIQNSIGTGGSVGTQITNAINALDSEKSGSSTSNHITVGVKQVDGKISSVTVSDSDIASAELLGTSGDTEDKKTAFGRIAKEVADRKAAIGALNFGPVSGTGKVITAITQTKGIVSATAATLSADNVAFTSSDTAFTSNNVSAALDTLYTRSGDGSKVVIDSGTTTEGYSKTYTFTQGGIEIGKIDIPKDLVVKSGSVVKGNWNDGVFTENVSGSGTALKLVIANKEETPIYINTLDLVKDHTAGSGISISDTNAISVVIDHDSEKFLSVSESGVKLDGVQAAIKKATTKVKLADGTNKITLDSAPGADGSVTYTIGQNDIASANDLSAEATTRERADTALSDRLGNGVTSSLTATAQFAELSNKLGTGVSTAATETVTAQLQALSGTSESLSDDTSVNGAKKYADKLVNSLNATITSPSETTEHAITIVQTKGKIESITLGAFDCGTY